MIPKKIDIKASANILFSLSGLCSVWFPIISAVVTSYDRQGERKSLSLFRGYEVYQNLIYSTNSLVASAI
jgi:hypothetical protein